MHCVNQSQSWTWATNHSRFSEWPWTRHWSRSRSLAGFGFWYWSRVWSDAMFGSITSVSLLSFPQNWIS